MKKSKFLFSTLGCLLFCIFLVFSSPNIETLISSIISFFSLIATVVIYFKTQKIQENQYCGQELSNLINEYRSTEFEKIIVRTINFWINECDRNLNSIIEKYLESYNASYNSKGELYNPNELTIHSCRRYLSQYYWSLWICIENNEEAQSFIEKYFNENEMNFFVIVHYMNKACANPQIYRNLLKETNFPKDVNDIYLENLYRKFDEFFCPEKSKVLKWID